MTSVSDGKDVKVPVLMCGTLILNELNAAFQNNSA